MQYDAVRDYLIPYALMQRPLGSTFTFLSNLNIFLINKTYL